MNLWTCTRALQLSASRTSSEIHFFFFLLVHVQLSTFCVYCIITITIGSLQPHSTKFGKNKTATLGSNCQTVKPIYLPTFCSILFYFISINSIQTGVTVATGLIFASEIHGSKRKTRLQGIDNVRLYNSARGKRLPVSATRTRSARNDQARTLPSAPPRDTCSNRFVHFGFSFAFPHSFLPLGATRHSARLGSPACMHSGFMSDYPDASKPLQARGGRGSLIFTCALFRCFFIYLRGNSLKASSTLLGPLYLYLQYTIFSSAIIHTLQY